MESAQEIIEISSDEDEGIGLRVPDETKVHPSLKRKRKHGGGNDLTPGASLSLSDDDETEVHPRLKRKRKHGGGSDLTPGASLSLSDDDDDCLILDGVPESEAAGSEYVELGGEMLDEMLIVGEKGQFACRDYPHPRYLCATFMFSMTPHRKYCNMCHCYVCDCPAPCIYWASHCGSTHKDQSWRVERQLFRRRKREQQHLHRGFDVKPAFTGLNRPIPKFAPPSFFSPNANAKPAWHHGPIQSFHAKTSPASPNQLVSKPSPSLLPNEPKSEHQDPIQHTSREQPRRPTETSSSRPKDILCEIYKNCPTVISCRRRIPPPLQPVDISDTDQDG